MPTSGGFGCLEILPPEVRSIIYEQVLYRPYWQIYRRSGHDGNFLLVAADRLPAIWRVSATIRQEVRRSVYLGRFCKLLIGTTDVRVNFPLILDVNMSRPLDSLDAMIPTCFQLLIGIELPSPRQVCQIATIRSSVKRIVADLNIIATRQRIPPIHISFEHSPLQTELDYRRNDFETLIGPFYALRLPINRAPAPLTIARCFRHYQSDDGREATCQSLEHVAQYPDEVSTMHEMHQLSIDIKLNLSLSAGGRSAAIPTSYIITKVQAAVTKLVSWHQYHRAELPDWLARCVDVAETVGLAEDVLLQRLVSAAVGDEALPGTAYSAMYWVEGHMAKWNPFWEEGEGR